MAPLLGAGGSESPCLEADVEEVPSSPSTSPPPSPHCPAGTSDRAQRAPLLGREDPAETQHHDRRWRGVLGLVGAAAACALCSRWALGGPPEGGRARSVDAEVVSFAGDSEHCSGHPGYGAQEARSWTLPASSRSACYETYHGSYNGKDMPPGDRNWCWVGLKRLGCHARLGYRLSWREMNGIAHQSGGLNPPEPFFPLEDPQVCDAQPYGATRAWSDYEKSTARAWFQENVHVVVLNLPMNRARWTYMNARLKELEIDATRVDGVDMRWESALADAMAEGLIPKDFDLEVAKVEAWKSGLGGILGRVGCASAHFRGQKNALKSGKPLAVVFEDDVWPERDFVMRVWQLVREELPCDWEAVSLSSKCPFGKCVSKHLTRVQPDGNEPKVSCRGGVNYGFQGMMYRTSKLEAMQKKWQKVVFNAEHPQCLDVDVAFASMSDEVAYYAVPFVQNPGFLSEIVSTSSRQTVDGGNPASTSCSAHAGCKGMIGECCPTAVGVQLGCCGEKLQTCGSIESGVDFVVESAWGYSVDHITSPDQCCHLCQKQTKCNAWTWVKNAGAGGQCWLKGGQVVSKIKKEGVVSGLSSVVTEDNTARLVQASLKEAHKQLLNALSKMSMMEITGVMQEGPLPGTSAHSKSEVASRHASSCPQVLTNMEYRLESANAWAVHTDHVHNPDACCAMCNKEEACVSWTFVKDAKLGGSLPTQCWLKGGNVTGVARKEGIIAGLRA